MSNTSDTIWDISEPRIFQIIDRLSNYKTKNNNIYFNFKYNFNRPVKITDF